MGVSLSVDEAVERKQARIRWHARRGLLENDLLLTRFLDARLASMDATEMALLEELLLWQDNDLLDVLMGRTACTEPRFAALVAGIKTAQ